MRRDTRLWNIICLITALSVFFAVMAEVRPARFSKPLMRRKNVHVLTEAQQVPDLAFFRNMSQRANRDRLGLSDGQKARMKEAFWKLFIKTIAIEQEAFSREQEASDREIPVFASKTRTSVQQLGAIFAGYLRAANDILTPEQYRKLHKRKPGAKRFERLHVIADLRVIAPTPSVSAVKERARIHPDGDAETTGATQQFVWATLARISSQAPLHHDLSQLQTLRL